MVILIVDLLIYFNADNIISVEGRPSKENPHEAVEVGRSKGRQSSLSQILEGLIFYFFDDIILIMFPLIVDIVALIKRPCLTETISTDMVNSLVNLAYDNSNGRCPSMKSIDFIGTSNPSFLGFDVI